MYFKQQQQQQQQKLRQDVEEKEPYRKALVRQNKFNVYFNCY